MPRPLRPKPPLCPRRVLAAGLALASLRIAPALAQVPIASSYSTRDGRIVSYTMACISTDGSFQAQPCGVAGYPLHVTLDGGTTPSSVTQSGPWSMTVSNFPTNWIVTDAATAAIAAKQPALNADGGAATHILNFPALQPVTDTATAAIAAAIRTNDAATTRAQTHDDQLAGIATAANQAAANASLASLASRQPALNADGGAAAHIANFPAVQTVTDTNSAAFQGVVAITPGTAVAAQRSLGFVISASGSVTLTLADASTITLTLPASTAFQTLPFAVTNVALGSGTAGSFWNLK